jgi:hypothetical protein
MSDFPQLRTVLQLLPRIRGWMQGTLLAFFLVVLLVLGISHSFQQLPTLLVIAALPLIMIIGKVKSPIPLVMQFVLLLVIASTCFGFLAVAALRTITVDHDQRNHDQAYATQYLAQYQGVSEEVDNDLLGKHEREIEALRYVPHAYPRFRDIILEEYGKDPQKAIQIKSDIDKLISFFDGVIQCVTAERCSDRLAEIEIGRDMRTFWYSFRPIIEEMRWTGYGRSYAKTIQDFVEELQPPESRSAVTRDEATGMTKLVFPNG